MNLKKLFFAAVIVLTANASFAQDTKVAAHLVTITIPQIALLDLEDVVGGSETVGDISLVGTAPTEAGEAMTFGTAATNNSIWMNYSSILGTAVSRKVTVSMTGTLPAGLKLTVTAGAYSGVGKGTTGAPTGIISLNGSPQDLIGGIGSAYTGNGAKNGHQLTYQLGYADTENYAGLDSDNSAALTITYTLLDI